MEDEGVKEYSHFLIDDTFCMLFLCLVNELYKSISKKLKIFIL